MFDTSHQYELAIRPLGRNIADEYFHNNAIWIEGRDGNNYTIDLTNRSHSRALFVLSVDGLDVLEGKPAGIKSQGYVITPGHTISVPGWKLNDQQAAEFFFSRGRDSYVNSIGGSTSNTGVIGAMVFQEYKETTGSPFDIATFYSGNSLCDSTRQYGTASAGPQGAQGLRGALGNPIDRGINVEEKTSGGIISQNVVSQEIGTGFGNATDWQTITTQFKRNNPTQPDTIMAVYYNTARNLEKMGINLRRKNNVEHKANPFPAFSSTSPGCITPPGWKP